MHRVADGTARRPIAFAGRARDDARAMKRALLLTAVLLSGCEDKAPTKVDKPDAAAAATPPPAPPEPPKPPKIVVEPGSFAINAERVNPTDPDPVGQIASLITGKPQVEGAMVEVEAKR